MKCAIISDLHFGDPGCSLVVSNKESREKYINSHYYNQLINAMGKDIDYLIILGDIFDFAIESYSQVYEIARVFFLKLKEDAVAKEIIYLPGNHDFTLWHTVEHEVNTINRIKNAKQPCEFKISVPGIIDDRKTAKKRGLTLSGVDERTNNPSGYGGLFLDYITVTDPAKQETQKTIFNIVFPNLYIVTDDELVLLTHGHYFERFWSFLGILLPDIASDDSVIRDKLINLVLKELVLMNFPLCQLVSSGIGQAGIFTDIARKIEADVKSNSLTLMERYLKNLLIFIDQKMGAQKWYNIFFKFIKKIIYHILVKSIIKRMKKKGKTLYQLIKEKDKDTLNRIKLYLAASCNEIQKELEEKKMPTKIIFGHTHKPIALDTPAADIPVIDFNSSKIPMYNSGGWLSEPRSGNKMEFCGAVIFLYETGQGFRSVLIQ